MKDKIYKIIESALDEIKGINNEEGVKNFRIKYLGKKGLLEEEGKRMRNMDSSQRHLIGEKINDAKDKLNKEIIKVQKLF